MPREGKRFAKPGRAGSNLRRANAVEELQLKSEQQDEQKEVKLREAGPSESVSAEDESAGSNYDDKDDEFNEIQDSKDQELDHEKKQGIHYANVNKKSSNLSRHNLVERLPTVKFDAKAQKEIVVEKEDEQGE